MSTIECPFNKDALFNLIKRNVAGCFLGSGDVFDNRYNCNVAIEDIPSVLRLGLLCKDKKVKICEGRELTKEEYAYYTSDHHVNGVDSISLSRMDIDFSKMYRDEDWYDASSGILANLVISNSVKASHVTHHFYNEFLAYDSIDPKYFEAIDVRVLRAYQSNKLDSEEFIIKNLLNQYNSLIDIAKTMKELGINIPLRESSLWFCKEVKDGGYMLDVIEDKSGIVTLDTDAVSKLLKIKIR